MEDVTNMNKKYGLVKFFAILFLISAISLGISYFFDKTKFAYENNDNYKILDYVSYTVLDSLYDSPSNSRESFNYRVKSYKAKYYDSLGIKLNDEEGRMRFDLAEKRKKLEDQGLNAKDFMTDEDYKNAFVEKKYENFYMSNYGSDKRDPLTINPREDCILAISGSVNYGKLEMETKAIDTSAKYAKNLEKTFKEKINEEFENLYKDEIKNIKFYYEINKDSPAYNNMVREIDGLNPEEYLAYAVLINAALCLAVCSFLSYKKIMNNSNLRKLFSIPLEGVLILFFTFMLGSSLILKEFFANPRVYDLINIIFLSICAVFGNVILSLCINYIILCLKSFAIDREENILVNNSLIFSFIYKSYKNIGKVESNEDLYKAKRNLNISYGIILILGFLYIRIFVYSSYNLLTLILYFGIFTGIYLLITRILGEIARINLESSKIAAGDYAYKIEKRYRIFDRLIDNLNSASKNLDLSVDKALKSERMKTELITNVSHDLKTPLTSIINYSDLLNNKELSKDEITNYAKIINDKSLKLKNLIEDLFEVSKASSNNIKLDLKKIDFISLLMQTVGEWEDKLKEKNINLYLDSPKEPYELNLDGQKISRVLDNIFSNIYKYGAENSRVYVDLKAGEKLRLVIKNISKYPLNISADELMERFTRGDRARATEGSGLGLSIAKSLVEAHGGKFEIEIDGDLFKNIIEL